MPPWTVPERSKTPRVPAGERSALESWLEYHRATLLIKCAGLTAEQLVTRSCPPSPLSLLGLVRHMAEVESWFHVFAGDRGDPLFCSDSPDADFEDADPRRADRDLAIYQASVERSRAAVAGFSLDELIPEPSSKPTSLRWVFQHMIEEYARHNGHADLLRERIDGTTGD